MIMAFWDLRGPGTQYVYGTNADDIVSGSTIYTNSMVARMYGGNDFVEVWAGYNNFVNGNQGEDKIEVLYANHLGGFDGSGGLFLGGSDNDELTNFGGSVYRMNGNNGDDVVTGLKGSDGEFRGGSGNDILSVHDGRVYGDRGSDLFVMRDPLDYVNSSLTEYAWVLDYTPGVDQVVYSSALGNVTYFADQNGLWLYQANFATMLLSGISSVNQVTFAVI